MNMIFAVDKNWNIGYDGDLLFKILDDLKRFKKITMGNVFIMGRKTFISLPESKPLLGREHIILTRDKEFKAEGTHIVHSIEEMDKKIEELKTEDQEIFLIGGGNLMKQLIDRIDFAYITKVEEEFYPCDTKIPNLDKDDNFKIVYEGDKMIDSSGLLYHYVNYERMKE